MTEELFPALAGGASVRQHPAKYTEKFFPTIARMLSAAGAYSVLDPMAGVGGVFKLRHWLPNLAISAIELEPEWAHQHPETQVGNCLRLPFGRWDFDAIVVSPPYGNRMADKRLPSDRKTIRLNYASHLGRQLSPESGAALQWGTEYRQFHTAAWEEADRVLRPGGTFIINIKDHIRDGVVQNVTGFHKDAMRRLRFHFVEEVTIPVAGMLWGLNREKRVEYESILHFEKRGRHE